jgi:hypothetical protein
MTPAERAKKLLLGTGLCLVFVFAIGLSNDRFSMTSLDLGWLFLIIGVLMVGLSLTNGSFTSQFPDESDEEMKDRVQDDVTETKREANIGDAWASLEHNVLTNELSESE